MQPYSFYKREPIFHEVKERLATLNKRGEAIDYLTFVPDGEPTLDAGLGESIRLLRRLGIKIVVISNGFLIGQEAVRANLKLADRISLKVDSVDNSPMTSFLCIRNSAIR